MRLFGLIGFPLGHSFSSGYFAKKFERENITNTDYVNFPIETIEELPEVLMRNRDLTGLNVTIPYKEQVIPFLSELDEEAEKIGAVNTIKILRDPDNTRIHTKGYNTDVYGFSVSLKEILHKEVKKALVLGTGGASKAILFSLESMGISISVVSRNPGEGQLSYNDLDEKIISEHLLIVNTSPVGTYPEVNRAPDIPYEFLGSSHILHDLVYNPEETLFMKKGKERGARVKNGYQMLVEQAEKSWEIWNQ
jgi:shikimate dehydrogenase